MLSTDIDRENLYREEKTVGVDQYIFRPGLARGVAHPEMDHT